MSLLTRRPTLEETQEPVAAEDLLRRFSERATIYWAHPADDLELIGLGCAIRLEAERAEDLRDAAREAMQGANQQLSGPDWARPRWFGGLAFDRRKPTGDWAGAPAATLLRPEVLIVRRGDEAWMTRTRCDGTAQPMTPGGAPGSAHEEGRSDWTTRVAQALVAIGAGQLRKVVLARRVARQLNSSPVDLLHRLREAFPDCVTFCLRLGADALFLGATPERLVRVADGRVNTAAVAGSAPRDAHPRQMLDSPKERAEHQLVVDEIADALAPHVDDLQQAQQPEILRLANVQHLITPFEGAVRPGRHVLDLVDALHPTPAVGGVPRAAAQAYLTRHEPLERGYYAAPLGWCDDEGNGDFWVAIRSALIRGRTLWAYAGAGIVAGSQPSAELTETELKLDAILEVLR